MGGAWFLGEEGLGTSMHLPASRRTMIRASVCCLLPAMPASLKFISKFFLMKNMILLPVLLTSENSYIVYSARN
jgi:hypothetical protein